MRRTRARELEQYALERLRAFFEPCPDAEWKDAALARYRWLFDLDRDAREALRVLDRTRQQGVRVFKTRGLPVAFDLAILAKLTPSARILLMALTDDKDLTPDAHRLLDGARRRSGSRDWLPPPLSSRGYVLAVYEECSVWSPPFEGPVLLWGEPPSAPRARLTDAQLALIHAFLFPVESLMGGDVSDAPRITLDRERRTMKKARHHWLDDVSAPETVKDRRFALPRS